MEAEAAPTRRGFFVTLTRTTQGRNTMSHDPHTLTISWQQPRRVVLAVIDNDLTWTIDVRVDREGIVAEIGRDFILCTSCEFGWNDKHDNESPVTPINNKKRQNP
jgi:hypothetical protein